MQVTGKQIEQLMRQGKPQFQKWLLRNPSAQISFSGIDLRSIFYSERSWLHPTSKHFHGLKFPGMNVAFNEIEFANEPMLDFSDTEFTSTSESPSFLRIEHCNFSDTILNFTNSKIASFNYSCRSPQTTLYFNATAFDSGPWIFGEIGNLDLTNAIIGKEQGEAAFVIAEDTVFHGTFLIRHAIFQGSSFNFRQARCRFKGPLIIEGVSGLEHLQEFSLRDSSCADLATIRLNQQLGCVPDFVGTKFSNPISLDDLNFLFDHDPQRALRFALRTGPLTSEKLERERTVEKQTQKRNEEKLRRLKEIAESNRDQPRALNFKIQEMQAARFNSTPLWHLPLELFYWLLGDYGRSVIRPMIATLFSWLCFAALYSKQMQDTRPTSIDEALAFSGKQMFPLVPIFRMESEERFMELFSQPSHILVYTLAITQTILSTILIFLIGLALRNRFRI